MPSPDAALINQLRWWLKLPPTNLIRRGDRLRFRHALFMMIRQAVSVLYGLNGRSMPATFSSIPARLDALPVRPDSCGARLESMVSTPDPHRAWTIAAGVMTDVLKLTDGEDAASNPASRMPSPRPVEQLTALAREAARRYALLPGIDAVALSGSLARGAADTWSDIDLSLYGRARPSPEERTALLAAFPGIRDRLIEYACDTAWIDGTLLHVRYWLTRDVERMLDALPRPPEDIFLAEDLQLCRPLHDPSGRMPRWKARVQTFSPALIASLQAGARRRRRPLTRAWEHAVAAQDRLHLYDLANRAAQDWLIALFAVNHRFLSTPRWTRHEMEAFAVIPHGSEERLDRIVGAMEDRREIEGRWTAWAELWAALPECGMWPPS